MNTMSRVRWFFIAIFFLITVLTTFFFTGIYQTIIPLASILSIFIAMFLHGTERYGLRNTIVFFLITWLVSHFFEAFSIQTGFPFGHYFYDKMPGPRLFEVPLCIMPAYFGTGYASWIISNILLGQYYKKLAGSQIFLIPFVATFIMVMWDMCIDPIASTALSMWVWRDGGAYFGVPLQNYFGWFLVVYIIFQLFALFIAKFDVVDKRKLVIFTSRIFWLEAIVVYLTQGVSQFMNPINAVDHLDIYYSMPLVTVFTMMFVGLLAGIKLYKEPR